MVVKHKIQGVDVPKAMPSVEIKKLTETGVKSHTVVWRSLTMDKQIRKVNLLDGRHFFQVEFMGKVENKVQMKAEKLPSQFAMPFTLIQEIAKGLEMKIQDIIEVAIGLPSTKPGPAPGTPMPKSAGFVRNRKQLKAKSKKQLQTA